MKYNLTFGLRLFLRIVRLVQKPMHLSKVEEVKLKSSSWFTAYLYDLRKVRLAKVVDHEFTSEGQRIEARAYYPNTQEDLPVILYFHGGGFVLGSIDSYDHFCRRLCKSTGHVIVAINYRLGPEHRFPAGHLDCLAGLRWLIDSRLSLGIDVNQICLMGDSAGGNLAAYLAFYARENQISIKSQVLIYPVLDESRKRGVYYEGLLVGENESKWFKSQYLEDDKDVLDPRLSILLEEDFSRLPKTLIIKSEYDHLNDEIDELHSKLLEAKNEVKLITYPRTYHGFITMFNWYPEMKNVLKTISQFCSSH